MAEPDYKLRSNPATAFVARIVILCVGGLLIYVGVPMPFQQADWWDHTSKIPFILGLAALLFGILAPNRWCEEVIPFWP